MRTITLTVGCALLAAMVGCVAEPEGSSESISSTLQTLNDNGTELSATAAAAAPVCLDSDAATVTISGVLRTTGAVDSADITVSIDGGPAAPMGTIEPDDFQHDGRVKAAPYSLDLTLTNGTYSIDLCFTQSGAQGREPKTVCAESVIVVIDCTGDDSCEGEEVFGDLVGNPVLCSGGGTPHVPVHLRGEFGEVVAIGIAGPNGFTLEDLMNHAGNSCIYQFNWDTRAGNHGGPGSYTFTFAGDNGNTFEFTRDLSCSE